MDANKIKASVTAAYRCHDTLHAMSESQAQEFCEAIHLDLHARGEISDERLAENYGRWMETNAGCDED